MKKKLTTDQIKKIKILKAVSGILNDLTDKQLKAFESDVKRRPLFKEESEMTGSYVRVFRDGEWQNIQIDLLNDEELEAFVREHPDDGWKWAKFFIEWLRDKSVYQAR